MLQRQKNKNITMKKIILSAIVLSITLALHAQEIPERKAEKHKMMERQKHHRGMAIHQLNLTDDQKEKFKSQREGFRKQMEDLKKNDNITVKEWKNKAESLRKENKETMGRILTSDQKAQLEKMKAEGKVKHEAIAKQRGEKMKTHLGLSDEQSAKLEITRKEMGEKMKSIRENKLFNEEQRKEQMKELMKNQKENMKSILTEEQLKKLKETRHQRPEGVRQNPQIKKTI